MKITTMPAVQCAPLRLSILPTAQKTAQTLWCDRQAAPLVQTALGQAVAPVKFHALHAVAAEPDDLRAAATQVLHAWSSQPAVILGALPGPEDILKNALTAQNPGLTGPIELVSLGIAGWHVWDDWDAQTPGERAWSVVKVGTQAAGLLCERVPVLHTLAPGVATIGMIVKIGGEAFALYETQNPAPPC